MPLPSTDSATDLLRLGFLIRNGLLTVDELQALVPPELRNPFIDKATDQPILARAIIGDARNDENLIVAQLQVLFLRLHNKLADATGSQQLREARRLTRWHYQWLVVNSYLQDGLRPGDRGRGGRHGGAALRRVLRHSTVAPGRRCRCRWSSRSRRSASATRWSAAATTTTASSARRCRASPSIVPFAPMNFLFGFTGDGRHERRSAGASASCRRHWVIEWDRFIKTDPARPTRSARKIDTELAPPLGGHDQPGQRPGAGAGRASSSSTSRGATCGAATG